MAKEELDFLDKYCKTKKIERESYEPFCDLIVTYLLPLFSGAMLII